MAPPATAEAAAADFTGTVAERLAAVSASADFTLRSIDLKEFRVHLVKLIEQSSVLRSLLSEVNTAELDLRESSKDVQLLIAGIYDALLPLTWDNVGPLLELGRKYDVRDIWHNCTAALRVATLNMDVLPRVLRLAVTYELNDVVAKCQEAIAAGDMFEQLKRKHRCNWYHDMPPAALATMSGRQRSELKKLREKCDAEHHNGDVPSKAAIKAGQEEACAGGMWDTLCGRACLGFQDTE